MYFACLRAALASFRASGTAVRAHASTLFFSCLDLFSLFAQLGRVGVLEWCDFFCGIYFLAFLFPFSERFAGAGTFDKVGIRLGVLSLFAFLLAALRGVALCTGSAESWGGGGVLVSSYIQMDMCFRSIGVSGRGSEEAILLRINI